MRDLDAALRVKDFLFKFCQQSKGQFCNQPLSLIDWQWDFVQNFYGDKRPDGFRTYTKAGIWIPKKVVPVAVQKLQREQP